MVLHPDSRVDTPPMSLRKRVAATCRRLFPIRKYIDALSTVIQRRKNKVLLLLGLFIITSVSILIMDFRPRAAWVRRVATSGWVAPSRGYNDLSVSVVGFRHPLTKSQKPPARLSRSETSPFGGFLPGLFLALGLSLCYHYRFHDDPFSLG
ncbi:MAG: hypothetical protein ACE5R6_17645 [Candidatus Heimdallarchaeota archaeon]